MLILDSNYLPTPKNESDPLYMYLVVRSSLNINSEKIAAQVGHAVQLLMKYYYSIFMEISFTGKTRLDVKSEMKNNIFGNHAIDRFDDFFEWQFNARKVVLQANETEWDQLIKEGICVRIFDAGYTEIPANSATVLGYWPVKKSMAPLSIQNLKLLVDRTTI